MLNIIMFHDINKVGLGAAKLRSSQPFDMMFIRSGRANLLHRTSVFAQGGVNLSATRRTAQLSPAEIFKPCDTFARRHIGPSAEDEKRMLKVCGVETMDDLISRTVPAVIRREPLATIPAQSESEALSGLKKLASQNKIFRSHIGLGYYGTITPPVILRNILENPGWYTPYTPYQAEISQGRLEMLLNFQTMVQDLTGMEIANSSLLDEATAAAEAMNLCYNSAKKGQTTFLISSDVHPQTIAVMKTRARNMGMALKVLPTAQFDLSQGDVCGAMVQYPASDGRLTPGVQELAAQLHEKKAMLVVASDLLALTVIKPPGEMGADITVGSAQRFGVPLGYGGPHAAFFACKDEHKRKMPGRVIGVSRDSHGLPALRMAMQTREQHIRRDKATSNICTAQALLANTAAAYAIYHGPEGLKKIATKVHRAAVLFAQGAKQFGKLSVVSEHLLFCCCGQAPSSAKQFGKLSVVSEHFFDTVRLSIPAGDADVYIKCARKKEINLRFMDEKNIVVSFDETNSTAEAVADLLEVLAEATGQPQTQSLEQLLQKASLDIPSALARTSPFMTHPVFNSHHSETAMLRYLYLLQGKDLSLATAMIPLGSCTMKLNATSEMIPVTWPEFGALHPFVPKTQAEGYLKMIAKLEEQLADITGFHAVSLQPNSGAQGEYTGLMVIDAWQRHRGHEHRKVCLIPTSAHGTNPASAAMMGMKVVVVKCDDKGNVDVADLKKKVEQHKNELSCLMITYPSTHGVFEEAVKDIIAMVHEAGGRSLPAQHTKRFTIHLDSTTCADTPARQRPTRGLQLPQPRACLLFACLISQEHACYLPPEPRACLLHACLRSPEHACYLPASSEHACYLPASSEHACYLPASSEHACYLPASSEHACYLPASSAQSMLHACLLSPEHACCLPASSAKSMLATCISPEHACCLPASSAKSMLATCMSPEHACYLPASSAQSMLATCLPPQPRACLLPACLLSPEHACYLPASSAQSMLATCLPPQPRACLLPACLLSQEHACYLPACMTQEHACCLRACISQEHACYLPACMTQEHACCLPAS
eukprot:g40134.t1